MKIYSFFWFPAVLASLAFTTSVKAEEVSNKAADLMGVNTDNQDPSNLLAQSSTPGFTTTSPTTGSAPLYTGGDNSQLPASNYFYLGGSVGHVFPSKINLTGKFTDETFVTNPSTRTGADNSPRVTSPAILQAANVPNQIENNISFYSGNQWNIVGGYQWDRFRAELEIGSSTFGIDSVSQVPGKFSATAGNNGDSITPATFQLPGGGVRVGLTQTQLSNQLAIDTVVPSGRDQLTNALTDARDFGVGDGGSRRVTTVPQIPTVKESRDYNMNVTTALVNAYYHLGSSKFRPYIGAGVGFGFISLEPLGLGALVDNGTSFAYQAKLGAQYEVVKKGNVFAEFKYLGLSGYTSNKNDLELKVGSSNVYGFSVGYRQGL
ncbi:P44/Msp2 family outer membrane protein [Cylindrospermopsis curvispora]|uniref:P44/Msp2 family outer membrane protein n=1 Tax=Cylindrospermopsis curvispora GIHE-G1 TaxID=2666332 RepID=A0A7H0EYQ9_9CYAN|nr:P44/Msp2 family outer membrane protein [Cylindrospermopsis curvispora]QNP28925.1 P44/Msp2 family outer membrane protein [Cylindrospermopsis curvispora GIHE-G1]